MRQATTHISQVVAANLKAARVEKGLTQFQLAQALGTQPNHVWRWESGKHRPQDTRLVALAEVLGKEIAWFFSEHEKAA